MTYRSEVLADSPSHYWPLSEPAGIVVADLINVQGTGGSVTSSVGFTGITSTDGAAAINNTNNNAYLGLKNLQYAATPCTFEAWVWIFGGLGTYQEVLMYGDTGHSLEMRISAASKLEISLRGGSNVGPTSTGIIGPTSWHHCVITQTATVGSVYIDGTLDTFATNTPSLPTTDPFGIGGFTDRTQPLNGFIGSPAIYPTALSATRILAHYNAAELKSGQPIFSGGSSKGDITMLQALLESVLNYVSHTYQNSP